MSLTRKIALNTAVQVAGKVVSTILGLVAIGYVTRALGPVAFGHYGTALAFLQIFGVLVDLGLYIVLLQKLASDAVNADSWASTAFTLRLITAAGFLAIAPIVGLLTAYPGDVKLGILIATVSTFAITMNQVLVGIFQKSLRMDQVTIAELIGRVALLGGTIFVAHSHPTVPWVLGAVALGSLVNFLMSLAFSRRYVRIRLTLDREKVRTIIREGWPIALSIAFNLVYFKADTIILSAVRPNSVELGLYVSAYKVLEVLTTFPAMFAGLLMPLLASAYAARDYPRFHMIMQKAVDNLALLAIPLAVGTGFVARSIMHVVGGAAYVGAAPVLSLLMVATACIFFGNLFANAVVAVQAQRRMLWAYGLVAVGSLVGYLLAIPHSGMYGAAWMTIASELAITLTAAAIVTHVVKSRLSLNVFLRILLACVPMVIILLLIPHASFVVRVSGAVVGYVVGLLLVRAFPTQLIREFAFRYARHD